MSSILLTGATGFIGGAILAALYKAHPEIHVKALIRGQSDAQHLSSIYPNLQPIQGDLASLDLLKETAGSVDFVIHAARENIPAAHAFIDGLASSFASNPPSPRFISISGTRSLIDLSLPVTGVGKDDAQPWSDIGDVRTILSLPKERPHAEADQSIVAHASASGVGAMLVSPGQLWGRGKGHFRKESAAATAYYAAVSRHGRAFVVGDGSVAWSWSSIGDLGDAVTLLFDQAMSIRYAEQPRVGVNEEGYYLVRTDEVKMKDRAEAISKRLDLGEVERLGVEVAAELHPFGPIMWGSGATFRADRLRSLGWRPKEFDWRMLMEEEGNGKA
ncbi:hypothetical protein LTR49_021840 [Elasticomyces elasticus]|nr:hypothetical protein LTR49_021840 [Elasticomyces elasticus]